MVFLDPVHQIARLLKVSFIFTIDKRGAGANLKRGEGVGVEMGGCHFFTTLQFSSIAFTFLDLQSFELAMQYLHPRSHPSLVLKPGIICTFLIHSVVYKK